MKHILHILSHSKLMNIPLTPHTNSKQPNPLFRSLADKGTCVVGLTGKLALSASYPPAFEPRAHKSAVACYVSRSKVTLKGPWDGTIDLSLGPCSCLLIQRFGVGVMRARLEHVKSKVPGG
jgi:hypothetical protein